MILDEVDEEDVPGTAESSSGLKEEYLKGKKAIRNTLQINRSDTAEAVNLIKLNMHMDS